jgi:hypothetical protein
MTDIKDLTELSLILGIIVAAYFVFEKLTDTGEDLIKSAEDAGAFVGKNLVSPGLANYRYATSPFRAAESNYPLRNIPETPEGYRPSNWTWEIEPGVHAGIPAGMTPEQFCDTSPDAPMCANIIKKGKNPLAIVGDWYESIGGTPWWRFGA